MSSSPRVRAMLFDMDGVLVDVSRSYRRAIEETTTHFVGRPPASSSIQRYKDAGGFNDDYALTHALIKDAGVQVSFGRVVGEFNRRYRGEEWTGFIASEPPLVTDRHLSAYAERFEVLGIVTGRPRVEAQWTLQRFGWSRYFPLVISRDESDGRGKPDPFPILRALAMLRAAGKPFEPSETVYVGDQRDDMLAARSAGLWAVGYVPHYLEATHADKLVKAGAHAVITDHSRFIPELDVAVVRLAGGEPLGRQQPG